MNLPVDTLAPGDWFRDPFSGQWRLVRAVEPARADETAQLRRIQVDGAPSVHLFGDRLVETG